MNNENLVELQKMRKNLSSNLGNADYLLKLGEIYYKLNFGGCIDFVIEKELKISTIVDWQSHQSSIKYSFSSFKLKPTIDSAILIMNSLNMVGNYSATIDFIIQQNLMEIFSDEKLTIMSLLLYSLSKKGLLLQSIQLLQEFSPDFFRVALQNIETAEDSPQRNLNRLVSATQPTFFHKGQTEDDFLGSCETLLDTYQRERNVQDYLATNIKWDYNFCLDAAVSLHKEGLIRTALQMYALAFTLTSLENMSEFYALASLHLMGEHQVAFDKLNEFIDKYPSHSWGYVVAGHSCAVINNTTGLELVLTKSSKNNVKLPVLDLLIGFLLESKGQIKQAMVFYEKSIQNSSNSPFVNIFKSRVERISHE
ncbi:MAG: hypothetical protein JW963_25825 [Anaerolineales bacterium]|nr:hypothetical protein [Anaerolineales bacterium]